MTTQEDYEEVLSKIEMKRIGEPTMKTYKSLRKDLKVIAKRFKTGLFPKGTTFGPLVLICEEEEYGSYIGNKEFVYTDPVPPKEYGVTITGLMTELSRPLIQSTLKHSNIWSSSMICVSPTNCYHRSKCTSH